MYTRVYEKSVPANVHNYENIPSEQIPVKMAN